jgi:hypothetical protein
MVIKHLADSKVDGSNTKTDSKISK